MDSRQPLFRLFKHQSDFVHSEAKYAFLCGGYGSGKTYGFAVKGLKECGLNPGKRILLAEPTYPMVRDVLQPTIQKVLMDSGFGYEYFATEMRYRIKWNEGWADILLRSAENYMRWAGLNLAAGGIDEADHLRDEKPWQMLLSRLRDGNTLRAFGSGTPEGYRWVWKNWEDSPGPGYELTRGRTTDNAMLPEDFITSLKENYPEHLLRAYLNGEFVNLQQGQTYYNFSRENNVKEYNYNPALPIKACIDFNVEPMACTLLQEYNETPKIRVFDCIELYHSGGREILTQRMAQEIKAKYKNNSYTAYPDPSNRRQTSALDTDHDILRQSGFKVIVKPAAPRVTDSVNAANKMLEKEIIIDPKAKGLIVDLEQTVNKPGTREIDKSHKDRTHFSDGFRYYIDYEYPIIKPQYGSIPR